MISNHSILNMGPIGSTKSTKQMPGNENILQTFTRDQTKRNTGQKAHTRTRYTYYTWPIKTDKQAKGASCKPSGTHESTGINKRLDECSASKQSDTPMRYGHVTSQMLSHIRQASTHSNTYVSTSRTPERTPTAQVGQTGILSSSSKQTGRRTACECVMWVRNGRVPTGECGRISRWSNGF
jgi:hypothetical protein